MTTTEPNQDQTSAGWDTSVAAPANGFFRAVLAISACALGYLLFLGSGILRHSGRESLSGALGVAADASAGRDGAGRDFRSRGDRALRDSAGELDRQHDRFLWGRRFRLPTRNRGLAGETACPTSDFV